MKAKNTIVVLILAIGMIVVMGRIARSDVVETLMSDKIYVRKLVQDARCSAGSGGCYVADSYASRASVCDTGDAELVNRTSYQRVDGGVFTVCDAYGPNGGRCAAINVRACVNLR